MTHGYRHFDQGRVARPTEYLPRVEDKMSQTLVMPKIKRRRKKPSRGWIIFWYLVILLGATLIALGM